MGHILDHVNTVYPFPPKPTKLSADEKTQYIAKIKQLLKDKNAVLIAHYYTDPEIQALAEETGGFVGDSLEMAKFGNRHDAKTLVMISWISRLSSTINRLSFLLDVVTGCTTFSVEIVAGVENPSGIGSVSSGMIISSPLPIGRVI